jgi:hypothetical protein
MENMVNIFSRVGSRELIPSIRMPLYYYLGTSCDSCTKPILVLKKTNKIIVVLPKALGMTLSFKR